MVQTPVGARCPACAKLSKLPTYQVPGTNYLRAAGVGLGMAIAGGIVWGVAGGILRQAIHFNFNLILAPAVGYAIGEMISRSVNRKRGIGLAAIAGTALVLGYLVRVLLYITVWGFHLGVVNIAIDLVAVALGIFAAVTRFH
jgi:hypothetical protein